LNATAGADLSSASSQLSSAFSSLASGNLNALSAQFGAANGCAPLQCFNQIQVFAGLVWTTAALYYILPCYWNCFFLCSMMFNANSVVDWIVKPENTKNRISINNVPSLLMFASCINKDPAMQIRFGPEAQAEGGEAEKTNEDIEN
jgi:hypothetical protein